MTFEPRFIRSVEECGDRDRQSVWHSRGDVAGEVKGMTVQDAEVANDALAARKAVWRWFQL